MLEVGIGGCRCVGFVGCTVGGWAVWKWHQWQCGRLECGSGVTDDGIAKRDVGLSRRIVGSLLGTEEWKRFKGASYCSLYDTWDCCIHIGSFSIW